MRKNENNSIFKPRTLKISDLPFLQDMGEIENGFLRLKKSARGYTLKTPISVQLDKILALEQRGLAEYIIKSLSCQRPMLIPFVLENRSLIELARYFLRYCSASPGSLYGYMDRIWRFSIRVGNRPDKLIADVKDGDGTPRLDKIQSHVKALENYIAELQDSGLSPGRVNNYAKAVKTLYRVNGISIVLPYPLSRKSVIKDRAPTPDELSKLLDLANLREGVIISLLALGGFREGTLAKLQYRHVKRDLERGMTLIHVHVEAGIAKGKYHDYDTFIGAEAAGLLKLYLDGRRKGSPNKDKGLPKTLPEVIYDHSPLIRDSRFKVPRPIGEKQVYKLVHNLYFKAGLLNPGEGEHVLKVHSLRKFFKTQLMALGIQPDYIDYMMGHTIDTYHDIQMKGVEFLRSIYAAKDFSIRPKPKLSPLEQMKILCKGIGVDPEKALVREAFAEPHRVCVTPEDFENRQVQTLSSAIKENIKQEILAEVQPLGSSEIRHWGSGPGGIRTLDLPVISRTLQPS